MKLRSFSWALLPILVGLGPQPARPTPEGQVSSLSLASIGGTARLSIAADRGVEVRQSQLQNPARLILDFEPATKGDFPSYDGQRRGAVTDIRVNQYKPDVVRVVLEFDRMPDVKVEQGLDGSVTVAYADQPFAAWGLAPRAVASSGTPVATGTVATAIPMTIEMPVHRAVQQGDTSRFSVNWDKTPIEDALNQLAVKAHRSIVPGKDVSGTVSMTLTNQTWSEIFQALLAQQDLSATVMAGDIIRVDSPAELAKNDSIEPLNQKVIRLNYAKAAEMANNVKGMLTKRGSVVADTSTNSLIIIDGAGRIAAIEGFIQNLDLKTPTISIAAKLIFVDRTELQQLGVKYDVGTATNFFNSVVQRTDPTTGQPFIPTQNVVDLGGNSVAAVSNADGLISGSALDLMFSTAIGGFSLTSFLSALEQVQLTDVEAQPIVNTLDNRQAQLVSGEQTPVRVIDASSFGQANTAPRANVQFKETGIKLTATPHVTANRQISMDLDVERSSIQLLASVDLGFNIPIQHGITRLLVNDGETAVIAGLTVTTVTRNRSGIPLLSRLPFLGNLFSFTTNSEHRQDLIILVTPRILDDPVGNQ
ncbi:MAG TPA: secretin N-terminal domain-containing protein [Gemmatimonadales bacterium]|jgi:type IV pilus assembly protein PilQ